MKREGVSGQSSLT